MSGLTRREFFAAATVTAAGAALPAATPAAVMTPAPVVAPTVAVALEALTGFQKTLHHTLPGLVTYGMRRWYGTVWPDWRCPPIVAVGEDAADTRLVANAINRVANRGPFASVNLATLETLALEAWVLGAFRAAHGGVLLLEAIDRLPPDLDRRIGGLIAQGADVWVLGTMHRRLERLDTVDWLGRMPLRGWPLLVPSVLRIDLQRAVSVEIDRALAPRRS